MNTISIKNMKPNYTIKFCNADQKEVGSFDFNGEQMVFTGNADEAAKVFIDYAMMLFNQRLEAAVLAERELCANVAEEMIASVMVKPMPLRDIVAAIRQRGEK